MNRSPDTSATRMLWTSLRTTPLADLLRGRLTGSLDLGHVIAPANLPDPLPGLVYETARRRRWLTGRRAAFARQMIYLLRAELASGNSAQQLAVTLGNPAQIGQLLRQGEGAGLPEPLADLIRKVARRTRLWRAERVDVARELAEHFRDGLAAGRTTEQLVESFGDARQAARLIRRAKLRSRPLFWRLWRRGVQALAAVAALTIASYLFLAIRFFTVHPTIAHNYRLDIIAPTQGVPEADRAWPFYREALLELTPDPEIAEPPGGESARMIPLDFEAERPGSKHWALVEKWLDENQAAIAAVRQGAARPRFGFVFNDPGDRAWFEADHTDPASMDPNKNESLVAFLLPQFQALRRLGYLLERDARRAMATGDRQAFRSDIEAVIRLAEQIRGDLAFVVVDLISFNIFERALEIVDEALSAYPDLLQDADLAHLAHRITAYGGGGPIAVRLTGERAMFHDFVQRAYSDNGHGDGMLTREGIKLLGELQTEAGLWRDLARSPTEREFPADVVSIPLAAVVLPRRAMTELVDKFYDRAEADFGRPLWQWNDEHGDYDFDRWDNSAIDQIRYAPLFALIPSILGIYGSGQRVTQERDATLVALAVTLFHRRHGAWPEQLTELVPDLLPTIPADRHTGEPIRYRVVDGKPLVYSVGPDKTDNGGQPPNVPQDQRVGIWCRINPEGPLVKTDIGWDWILWPPATGPGDEESKQ